MKIPKNKNNQFDFGRLGGGVTTRLTARVAIALLSASVSATLCLFAMSNTEPIVNPPKGTTAINAPNAVPFKNIGSPGGPLTGVFVGNELSCQVAHVADATFEFYPPNTRPGDCGTFIALGGTNGTLYAPNFGSHGGTATSIGAYVPFTPFSQTVVTGNGLATNPFTVVTVVDAGTTGLRIQQTDMYVAGDESYRTDTMIINSNTSGGPANGVLYRAGDAFLAGSDYSRGFTETFGNRKAVGCSVNANNVPSGRVEEWIPLTGGNSFHQNSYLSVWNQIALRGSFTPTCACPNNLDSAAGISWNFSIPAGGSATFSHLTSFSFGRRPLVTSKTADSPTSVPSAQDGYTITIQNPNLFPVTLGSITDTLPAGFSYAGPTTPGLFGNPIVSGQMITWSGSFVVPANGSVSLHFAVIVASVPGNYLNEASGHANGGTVVGTGPTAQITVVPCPGTIFGESFDGVIAPALPQDWMASGPAPLWTTSTTNPDTDLNSAFVAAPATMSDNYLDSPEIAITSASAQVSFRHNYNLQDTFDGGVLEVSIDGGPFVDILAPQVGGTFVTGGYDAEIDPGTGSPIAGRPAWTGSSCGYICTVANLGASLNGTTIRLRFRMGTDTSVASPGWRVDTIQVLAGGSVCGPCVTPTLSPAKLLNASARSYVGTGANVLIAGFIITGSAPKYVVLRGIGPSLPAVLNPLADPILELRDSNSSLLASNDNWRDTQQAEITATGLALTNDLESGIAITLPPCASYTAILTGKDGGTGVGRVEIYDLNPAANSELAQFSALGFLPTSGDVIIGGFILGGNSNATRVALRGMGPSLPPPFLANPTLQLQGGVIFVPNDDWMANPGAAVEFPARGLAPLPTESGIFTLLLPGTFTDILAGGPGRGRVEIYNVH